MINYYLVLRINKNLINDAIIFNDKDDVGYSGHSSLKIGIFPFCKIEAFKKEPYIIVPISQIRFNDFLLSKKDHFVGKNYISFLKKEGFEEYAI